MYIPKYFKQNDIAAAENFVSEYPFATLVSTAGDAPIATHIPVILDTKEGGWKFTGHISLENPHHNVFGNQNHLLIFQGPHAYISPTWYEHKQNVPTWNYIAVHCYGTIHKLGVSEHLYCLENMINVLDPDYFIQWQYLDADYKEKLATGIVAFTFEVTEIKAVEKLSQNKSYNDRKNITQRLSHSDDSSACAIARRMNILLQNSNDVP